MSSKARLRGEIYIGFIQYHNAVEMFQRLFYFPAIQTVPVGLLGEHNQMILLFLSVALTLHRL